MGETVYYRTDYLKYTACGAKTFAEIAAALESSAAHYRELAGTGKVTIDDTDGVWVHMSTADPDVAEEYGFEKPECDEEGGDDDDGFDDCDPHAVAGGD